MTDFRLMCCTHYSKIVVNAVPPPSLPLLPSVVLVSVSWHSDSSICPAPLSPCPLSAHFPLCPAFLLGNGDLATGIKPRTLGVLEVSSPTKLRLID